MEKRIIKFWDKIVVVLLGLLGIFNSCEKPCEYGTPLGEYKLNGIVTDKETANPIQNIQVVRFRNSDYGDTLYTDAEGKYAFHDFSFGEFHLKFEDIDGEENGGEFKTKEIKTKLTQADQVEKGDGKWNDGKFVKTVNIELEKK